jgi:hypothetical protein
VTELNLLANRLLALCRYRLPRSVATRWRKFLLRLTHTLIPRLDSRHTCGLCYWCRRVTPQDLEEDTSLSVSAFKARRGGWQTPAAAAAAVAAGGALGEGGRAMATVAAFGALALAGADYALTGGAAVEAVSGAVFPGASAVIICWGAYMRAWVPVYVCGLLQLWVILCSRSGHVSVR